VRALALIGPSWPLRGGIARTTTLLAGALAARGALAGFFVPERQYPRWLYPGARDTDPRACPRLDAAQACFRVMEPRSWRALSRRLAATDADAIVFPYWTSAWAPLEAYLTRTAERPSVAIVHNAADHDAGWLARRAARTVLRRCDAFLRHGADVARAVDAYRPGTPAAVHPLPPQPRELPERAAARARLGIPPERTAALCFGLIRPYKGVEVLLDAVERLPSESPLTLLLAGEPWGRAGARLRRRLAAPRLAGRVVSRLAWVPEDEAGDWFAAADLAVLPYRTATGSAVASQALGLGLPIVASRVGGLVDIIDDGVDGLLVPPGEPAALASALSRLVDPATRAALAAGARRTAARWTWNSYADALESLADRARDARRSSSGNG